MEPDSRWHRSLRTPPRQPPPWAFGTVRTPLYAAIAWAGGHAPGRTRGPARRALAASKCVSPALTHGRLCAFAAALDASLACRNR